MFKNIIIAFLLTAGQLMSQAMQEKITGSYCYTWGDNETLLEARALAHTLAVRNAIESYHVFVEAASLIENFVPSVDIIQSITAGYVDEIKVTAHTEEGRTICETVECTVNPETFAGAVKNLAQRRIDIVREMGIDNNGFLKILNVSKFKFDTTGKKAVEVIAKVLQSTGRLDSVQYRNSKPMFKVCITWLDRSGSVIDGTSQYVHTNAESMAPGEITRIIFNNPPLEAVSWKGWLVK